jgi:hypothetical protein
MQPVVQRRVLGVVRAAPSRGVDPAAAGAAAPEPGRGVLVVLVLGRGWALVRMRTAGPAAAAGLPVPVRLPSGIATASLGEPAGEAAAARAALPEGAGAALGVPGRALARRVPWTKARISRLTSSGLQPGGGYTDAAYHRGQRVSTGIQRDSVGSAGIHQELASGGLRRQMQPGSPAGRGSPVLLRPVAASLEHHRHQLAGVLLRPLRHRAAPQVPVS